MSNIAAVIDGHDPRHDAIITGGEVVTYGQLRSAVAAVRGGLVRAGVKPGDRVALLLANGRHFVITHLAAVGVGAIVVPLNPLGPTAELQRQLDSVQAAVAVVGPAAARAFDGVDRAVAGISHVFALEGVGLTGGSHPYDELTDGSDAPMVDRSDSDLAVLMFTSGTAGSPRAAELTHGNLRANLDQVQRIEGGAVSPGDTLLCALPLHHIFGLNATLHLGLLSGARVLLVQRFDPVASLESIQRHHVTVIAGVPPMYAAWASLPPDVAPADAFAGARMVVSGASRLDPAISRAFFDRFGVEIGEGYGLTEAAPTVTAAPYPAPRPGTIGVPLPGVEVRVVDSDGSDVVVGDPGEIWVRGPNVFHGYWRDPDATAGALDAQGWLHTGDIAVVDSSGYLTLVDRVKDLIIVSGFNVYPAEVEAALLQHPGIREAAVVGVASPQTGEAVSAFVVPRDGRTLDEDEVIEFCSAQLARYKCPSKVRFVPELPRQASGKLLRRTLL